MVQAIELVMKEALRREHHWLVFRNVDKRALTVSWDEARSRLRSLGLLNLEEQEEDDLQFAFKKRNEIMHHEVTIEPERLKPVFAKLLGLTSDLYWQLLGEELSAVLPESSVRKVVQISEYGQELERRTVNKVQENYHRLAVCPDCGWRSLEVDEDLEARCRICPTREAVIFCDKCDAVVVRGTEIENFGKVLCVGCHEYEEEYGEYLGDLHRDNRP
ncbi:MAG: hypothetical protein AB7O54_11265 [Pseudomonadales bacterium]